jgi:hypothetical protein
MSMKTNRFGRLAAVLAVAVTAAVVCNAPPVSAAPAEASPPAGSVAVTNGEDAAGVDAAGNACRVGWSKITHKDVFGITLWWLKMTTTWCYNGVTVTSHSTSITHDVTGPGTALGWSWHGQNSGFACYVAKGSSRNCSGNHEWVTAQLDFIPLPVTCVQKLNEWENYHGQFFWSSAGSTC